MNRVRSFFLREAEECLADIGSELGKDRMDIRSAYAAARRLRGSAQLARFAGVAATALSLERRLRSYVVVESGQGGAGGAGTGAGLPGVAADDRGGQPAEAPDGEEAVALQRQVREVLTVLRSDLEAVRDGRLEEDPRREAGMETRHEVDDGGGGGVVPVDTLEYRGEAALERALSLREPLEDAIVSDEPAGPLLDELFDLIRLGAK